MIITLNSQQNCLNICVICLVLESVFWYLWATFMFWNYYMTNVFRLIKRVDISTEYKMIETFSWYINFALKAEIHIKCHHIWLFLLLEWPFALISNLMKSILSTKTRNAWAISLNWYIEKREGIALKIVPFHQNIYIIKYFYRYLPELLDYL